jgi:DNA mismatch endonuclease (patch repair protein)
MVYSESLARSCACDRAGPDPAVALSGIRVWTESSRKVRVDKVTAEQRSRMMAAVRGRNTLPEISVRKALFAAGYRFRLHDRRLPGKPDIVLPKYRTVVMVHGCFWHGHSCRRGKRPSSNQVFWERKIDANIERDKQNIAALKVARWYCSVIWECELESGTGRLIARLKRVSGVQRATTRSGRRSAPDRASRRQRA